MSNSLFTKKALHIAICSAMVGAVSTSVWAEELPQVPKAEAAQQVDDAESENTVVITGMRASVATSQLIKRVADTVMDVVTASDIGALPDKSVTEAIMRVPGVTVERFAASDDPNHFAAEGTGVVIRGLKRVRSEINGRDSFSARRDGGGLNYEDIPAELLGSIQITKNHTADLIAGGIAGTVNLVTRKPFDSEEMIVSGQIKESYGDHRQELTPSLSGMFSNVWDTNAGTFGFLIGGAKSEFADRGDGVAIDNFYERSATAAEMPQFGLNGTELTGYAGQTLYVPAGVALRRSDSERDRTGLVSSAQWKNNDDTVEVTLEFIKSNAQLSWDERTVQYGEQGFNVDPANAQVSDAAFDSNGIMASGSLLQGARSVTQTRWRDTETDVEDTSLHLKYRPTDALKLDFDVQKIKSDFKAVDYTISSAFSEDNVYLNTTGDVPTINYVGNNLTSPLTREEIFINSAMDKEDDHDAESTSYAFDFEYETESDWLYSVKGGAYFSEKKQTIRDSLWNWGEVAYSWDTFANGGFTSNALDNPELYEEFAFNATDFHGGGVLPANNTFLFPRLENVHNWQDYHDSTGVAGTSTFGTLRDRADVIPGTAYLPSEISSAKEDRKEFYLRADFSFDEIEHPIKGNIGLRHVQWQVESTGATQFPEEVQSWQSDFPFYTPEQMAFQNNADGGQVKVKAGKYSKVLPSFNLSLDAGDDQIIRFAISENVYFPEFRGFRFFRTITQSHQSLYDSSGNFTGIANVQFDGETGNPEVKPEEALSIDFTYEWYFAEDGSLTLSLFRKDLDNIIRKRLFTEDVTNPVSGQTFPVNFSNNVNEGSGTLTGFEISYTQFYDSLPGAWGGLGFSANYTNVSQNGVGDKDGFGDGISGQGGRNNFRAFNNLDLPGYSDDTLNIALMYAKYDIDARLAWNWRSEYLLTRRDSDLFAPVIADDTGQLDASISYKVNDSIKVGFEASNLLDEIISTKMMMNQKGDLTPRSFFKTDKRYGLYIRANF